MDNIKKDFHDIECGSADWIRLARNKDQWRAVLYTVIIFELHKSWGTNLLVSEGLLSF